MGKERPHQRAEDKKQEEDEPEQPEIGESPGEDGYGQDPQGREGAPENFPLHAPILARKLVLPAPLAQGGSKKRDGAGPSALRGAAFLTSTGG